MSRGVSERPGSIGKVIHDKPQRLSSNNQINSHILIDKDFQKLRFLHLKYNQVSTILTHISHFDLKVAYHKGVIFHHENLYP